MISLRSLGLAAIYALLISCGAQQDRSPAIGQAFVGPTTLTLRQELSSKAAVSATVHHGEQLEILEFKRRFIKVRTAGGIAGWTDVHQLLTPEQMTDLRHIAERAAAYPSQGVGTTFEALNVHTEPSRASPSFLQIPEGGKIDVIGHKVTPRTQAATPMTTPAPRPRPQRKRKEKASSKIPPPPMPPAPKPPRDWLEMSRTPKTLPDPREESAKANAGPQQPVRLDDWTLIRTKDGRVGWILSRMINMAIPDDVAQYAEGHRITSYFSLGDVQDEDQLKHNWLWTTIGKGPQNYEFDSFRFFIWSKRHHRYETAYILRNVTGHYPVIVHAGATPTFTLILEDDDGKLVKKTYTFNGYRVTLLSAEPFEAPPPNESQSQPSLAVASAQPEQKAQGWLESMKARVTKLFRR